MTDASNRRRIFFAEYCCGGGMMIQEGGSADHALSREGIAMWRAMVEDLSQQGDVTTPVVPHLMNHQSLCGWTPPASVRCVEVASTSAPWRTWTELAIDCEVSLVVAPETDGILAMAIGAMRGAGIHVIALGPESLRIATDKLLTAKFCRQNGIPHPVTFATLTQKSLNTLSAFDRWVIKPRDGCGSTDVRVYDDCLTAAAALGEGQLIQSYHPGRAASVLVIAAPGHSSRTILPGVWQTVTETKSANDPFSVMAYEGGSGPVDQETQRKIEALACRVLEELPGCLEGFLGLDIVVGQGADPDTLIELNPRLTTSYIGMRQMVDENLSHRLFAADALPIRLSASANQVEWSIHAAGH